MFTIKFYSGDGFRQVIEEAESFTVLRNEDGTSEISLHHKNGDGCRRDINDDGSMPGGERFGYVGPPRFGLFFLLLGQDGLHHVAGL